MFGQTRLQFLQNNSLGSIKKIHQMYSWVVKQTGDKYRLKGQYRYRYHENVFNSDGQIG